ncbi:hypothetical protein QWZ10_16190 [Paracoccus cavernae]|uniref:NUDIX domain-containing protein n=1 Tax=Paracoccus cavernae TaxID=1571207 RepID=A0ABT8D806_9RHOB|nr:hypothetical protein [Paracoccus cavernae]
MTREIHEEFGLTIEGARLTGRPFPRISKAARSRGSLPPACALSRSRRSG